jgi:hypothetical protein
MLSAPIAYEVLSLERPQSIEKVKAVLEKHPWYANQWQTRLQDVPTTDHGLVLFMQAARWADDIRTRDKAQNRPPWHYVNLPFKREGQPDGVQTRDPEPVNILTALAENESVVKKESDGERKAIGLAIGQIPSSHIGKGPDSGVAGACGVANERNDSASGVVVARGV